MNKSKEYKEYIEQNFMESKKSALEVSRAILHSELNAGGQAYTRTLHIPKIFTHQDKQNFTNIVNTTYGIFKKVIQAYRKDEDIRLLFPFDKRLEELILLPKTYDIDIPICRVDIFYDEETKDFYFCEFNTDGTSAMNENRRLHQFLKEYNNVYQQDTELYEEMELLHKWTKEFLKTARSIEGMPEKPNIAIVDFLDHAYLSELKVYQKEFSEMGCLCEVVDIRELSLDGKELKTPSGMKVDVIYRRAVTSDVMEKYDEVQSFIQAVKEGYVAIIGQFQTQLVHHKEISKILVNPMMQKYFTQEEIDFIHAHVPNTYDLNQDVPIDWKEKDQWIIKPKDSFASKGVWAGVDYDQEQWEQKVLENMDNDYIIQRYIRPYQSENIDLVNSDEFDTFSNMSGLYVFNGQFAGVYSRMSDGGIISTQYNEKTVPTLFTKD